MNTAYIYTNQFNNLFLSRIIWSFYATLWLIIQLQLSRPIHIDKEAYSLNQVLWNKVGLIYLFTCLFPAQPFCRSHYSMEDFTPDALLDTTQARTQLGLLDGDTDHWATASPESSSLNKDWLSELLAGVQKWTMFIITKGIFTQKWQIPRFVFCCCRWCHLHENLFC